MELVDYEPMNDDLVPERTNNDNTVTVDDGDNVNNKYVDELECFLQDNLSNKKYRTAQTLMINATEGQVQICSSHLIFKTAHKLVKPYKIRNVEIDDAKKGLMISHHHYQAIFAVMQTEMLFLRFMLACRSFYLDRLYLLTRLLS